MLVATSHSAEVSKLKQSLEQADQELDRVKTQLEDKQGAAAEVESLKNALTEAQKKAEKEQAARKKHESRVGEVQQDLKDAINKCESLERKIADQESKLDIARQSASMLVATSHSAEVSKLKQSLEQADQELDRVKTQLEDKQGAAAEVESLKNALTEAQKKAEKEQAARKKHESRVGEVQQDLKDAINKCESLERKIADQESKLDIARQSVQEARVEARRSSGNPGS
nr:tropomyosin-like [Aegilops tauschii subsp. strangulata]